MAPISPCVRTYTLQGYPSFCIINSAISAESLTAWQFSFCDNWVDEFLLTFFRSVQLQLSVDGML